MRLSCIFRDSDGKQFGLAGESGQLSVFDLFCLFILFYFFTGWQAMNEITLHRGRSPHLNIVDVYVDGVHLTEAYVRSPGP